MPLDEVMEKHTEEERDLILYWMETQKNEPDRHDYYLMQIAQCIRGLFNSGVSLESQKIPFVKKPSLAVKPTEDDVKLAAKIATETMIARLGGHVTARRKMRDGSIVEEVT